MLAICECVRIPLYLILSYLSILPNLPLIHFATFDCTLRAYNAADISAGPDSNYSQRPVRADYLSANHSMSAGHVIFPLIGSVASNSRTVQWNCTLVLKTLLP